MNQDSEFLVLVYSPTKPWEQPFMAKKRGQIIGVIGVYWEPLLSCWRLAHIPSGYALATDDYWGFAELDTALEVARLAMQIDGIESVYPENETGTLDKLEALILPRLEADYAAH